MALQGINQGQKTSIQDYLKKISSTPNTDDSKKIGEKAVQEHGLGQQVQQQVQQAGSNQEVANAIQAASGAKGAGGADGAAGAGGAGGSQGAGQAGGCSAGGCCGKGGCGGGCGGQCGRCCQNGRCCVNGQCNPTPPTREAQANSEDGGNSSAINGDNNTVNQTTIVNNFNGPTTVNQSSEGQSIKPVSATSESASSQTGGSATSAPTPSPAPSPAPEAGGGGGAAAAPAPVADSKPAAA